MVFQKKNSPQVLGTKPILNLQYRRVPDSTIPWTFYRWVPDSTIPCTFNTTESLTPLHTLHLQYRRVPDSVGDEGDLCRVVGDVGCVDDQRVVGLALSYGTLGPVLQLGGPQEPGTLGGGGKLQREGRFLSFCYLTILETWPDLRARGWTGEDRFRFSLFRQDSALARSHRNNYYAWVIIALAGQGNGTVHIHEYVYNQWNRIKHVHP